MRSPSLVGAILASPVGPSPSSLVAAISRLAGRCDLWLRLSVHIPLIVGAIPASFVGAILPSHVGAISGFACRCRSQSLVGANRRSSGRSHVLRRRRGRLQPAHNGTGARSRTLDGMRMHRIVPILTALFLSSPVLAQSVYVVGAIGGGVVRAGRTATDGLQMPAADGETASGAGRVGVALNERWGVELEMARGGWIQHNTILDTRRILAPDFFGVFDAVFEVSSRDRVATVSTVATVRQPISGSTEFVYRGGVVFHRTNTDVRTTQTMNSLGRSERVEQTSRTRSVWYGAGPVVGFESHVRFGEHLRFVPGIRMYGMDALWLIRPSAGLGWTF